MLGKLDTHRLEERVLYVYTPPSYEKSPEATYPLMIVQDGQYLFMDSMVELEADFVSGVTQEIIFVGIEPNGRDQEYTPWPAPPLRAGESFGGQGDQYLQLVTETVIPFVKEQYRVVDDSEQTGITGGSLGALISLYAAFQKPHSFGRFAFMSASLWYEKFLDFIQDHSFAQSSLRLYMYVGEQEGVGRETLQRFMVPNTKKTYELLKDKVPGGIENIRFETDPDGVHDHSYFNRYFPNALRFLYPGS
jgi:predicted alpha/beta superfamily hydrolase